jgi:hypothetical protein
VLQVITLAAVVVQVTLSTAQIILLVLVELAAAEQVV